MFRIECFCDDRSLAKLLWALAGLGAYNVASQPVADNKAKSNGHDKLERIAASLNGDGGHKPKPAPKERQRGERLGYAVLAERFVAYARKRKLKEIEAEELRKFVTTLGWQPSSYSYALSLLRKVGHVVRAPGTEGSKTLARWIVRLGRPKKIAPPKSTRKRKSTTTKEATP